MYLGSLCRCYRLFLTQTWLKFLVIDVDRKGWGQSRGAESRLPCLWRQLVPAERPGQPLHWILRENPKHDDVIKWNHFLRYWPFVQRIHRSPVPTQRPVTRSFGVFFYLCLNKRLSKQSSGCWFETLSRPLWRHCNGTTPLIIDVMEQSKSAMKLHFLCINYTLKECQMDTF